MNTLSLPASLFLFLLSAISHIHFSGTFASWLKARQQHPVSVGGDWGTAPKFTKEEEHSYKILRIK